MSSEPRIDRLAFQREHTEHAFMHAAQRLALDEPVQRFEPERELANGQPAFGPQSALTQPIEMNRHCVVRPIDDSQILFASALDSRLNDAFLAVHHELERLYDHAFAAG